MRLGTFFRGFCYRLGLPFEVLLYGGVLWWPDLEIWEFQARARSAAECLEDIRSDRYLFETPDNNAGLRIMEEPPKIRTLVETDYAEKLAISQRKTYENFLICGDHAYVRGVSTTT